MPEIDITNLSYEQMRQLDKVIDIFGNPPDFDDALKAVQVIETARLWYLNLQRRLRMERNA